MPATNATGHVRKLFGNRVLNIFIPPLKTSNMYDVNYPVIDKISKRMISFSCTTNCATGSFKSMSEDSHGSNSKCEVSTFKNIPSSVDAYDTSFPTELYLDQWESKHQNDGDSFVSFEFSNADGCYKLPSFESELETEFNSSTWSFKDKKKEISHCEKPCVNQSHPSKDHLTTDKKPLNETAYNQITELDSETFSQPSNHRKLQNRASCNGIKVHEGNFCAKSKTLFQSLVKDESWLGIDATAVKRETLLSSNQFSQRQWFTGILKHEILETSEWLSVVKHQCFTGIMETDIKNTAQWLSRGAALQPSSVTSFTFEQQLLNDDSWIFSKQALGFNGSNFDQVSIAPASKRRLFTVIIDPEISHDDKWIFHGQRTDFNQIRPLTFQPLNDDPDTIFGRTIPHSSTTEKVQTSCSGDNLEIIKDLRNLLQYRPEKIPLKKSSSNVSSLHAPLNRSGMPRSSLTRKFHSSVQFSIMEPTSSKLNGLYNAKDDVKGNFQAATSFEANFKPMDSAAECFASDCIEEEFDDEMANDDFENMTLEDTGTYLTPNRFAKLYGFSSAETCNLNIKGYTTKECEESNYMTTVKSNNKIVEEVNLDMLNDSVADSVCETNKILRDSRSVFSNTSWLFSDVKKATASNSIAGQATTTSNLSPVAKETNELTSSNLQQDSVDKMIKSSTDSPHTVANYNWLFSSKKRNDSNSIDKKNTSISSLKATTDINPGQIDSLKNDSPKPSNAQIYNAEEAAANQVIAKKDIIINGESAKANVSQHKPHLLDKLSMFKKEAFSDDNDSPFNILRNSSLKEKIVFTSNINWLHNGSKTKSANQISPQSKSTIRDIKIIQKNNNAGNQATAKPHFDSLNCNQWLYEEDPSAPISQDKSCDLALSDHKVRKLMNIFNGFHSMVGP